MHGFCEHPCARLLIEQGRDQANGAGRGGRLHLRLIKQLSKQNETFIEIVFLSLATQGEGARIWR